MTTPADKDAQVLAVLRAAGERLGPTDIARRINQPWCMVFDHTTNARDFPASAAVTPILRRIGAVRHVGGKYTAPAGPEVK